MSDRAEKWFVYSYLAIVVLCLLLVNPVRAGLCYYASWSFNACRNFPFLVALSLSIIGTLIARYVIFKNEYGWWITFWTFCGLLLLYCLMFAGVSMLYKDMF